MRVTGGLFLLMMASVAVGSDADVLAAIRGCASEKNDPRRLACYDAAVNVSGKVVAAPAAVATAAPSATRATSATPATPEDRFGYRGAITRQDEANEPPGLEELAAKVTEIAFQPRGQFIVTLDNGQVWMQKQPETKVKPRVGETVTIKDAAFGSFMLVTSSGRSTRVSRVR